MPLPTSFVVKNGSKILRLDLLRHARAVVADFERDGVALGVVPGPDHERAAAVRRDHRLFGVDDEVEQHLLDLMRVGKDLRAAPRRAP